MCLLYGVMWCFYKKSGGAGCPPRRPKVMLIYGKALEAAPSIKVEVPLM